MGSDVRSASLDDPRTHIHAVGSAILVFLLALLSATITVSIGSSFISSVGVQKGSALSWASGDALQFVGFGIAGVAYTVVSKRTDLVSIRLPTRTDIRWFIIGLIGLIGSYAAATAIFGLLGISGAESVIIRRAQSQPVYLLYLIPVTILLVGPTEELIFRGLIQGVLDTTYGPKIAIPIASVIFMLPHFFSYIGEDLMAVVPTLSVVLLLGGVLGLVYEKSENLVVPAAIHGLFNTVQFAVAYATVTGLIGA
jgi:membrane protease YdiL (CAAX protease family)